MTLAVLAVLACLVVAACGDSDDSGDSGAAPSTTAAETNEAAGGVEEAKKLVTEAMALPKWESPGPAFDASVAKGKTVWFVSVAYTVPIQQTLAKAMTEALKTVGAKVRVFDTKGNPPDFARGIDVAVDAKADAIVLGGIPSKAVEPQIAEAEKAGIPVITTQTHDPGLPLDSEPSGVFGEVTFCYSCVGKALGQWAVADTGGKLNGVIFSVSTSGLTSKLETDGITNEVKRLCSECKLKVVDVSVPEWSTRLPTLTQSLLKQDPTINYLMPLYDGMVLFVQPAVHQANAASRVKIASFNATPPVMKLLEKEDVVAADMGGASIWQGWGFADMALRAIAKEPPVESENIPLRLFTGDNIGEIDINASEDTWYGPADFRSEYKKLWGVS